MGENEIWMVDDKCVKESEIHLEDSLAEDEEAGFPGWLHCVPTVCLHVYLRRLGSFK